MQKFITTIVAGMAVFATAAPVFADDEMSPAGVWAAPNQRSRYEFSFCGDGTQLCGKVVYMGPGKDRATFESELGKTLLDGAKPKGKLTWVGKIRLLGHEADGKIEMIAPDQLKVTACQYLVVCKDITLVPPIDPPPPPK